MRSKTDITSAITDYRAGRLSLDDLAKVLGNREYAQPTRFEDPDHALPNSDAPASEAGTWDEVQHAVATGLLTSDEYLEIAKAAHASHPSAGSRKNPAGKRFVTPLSDLKRVK